MYDCLVKQSRTRVNLQRQIGLLALGIIQISMKVDHGLLDFPVDHVLSVRIKLRNFFIEIERESVVVCLPEGQVVEDLDIFVEQSAVIRVDRAHAVGGIQHRNNDHDGKRQESYQDFGTNFQVCKQTHGGIPSLMRQPASSQKERGVAGSLASKLSQQKLRDLSVQAEEASATR